MQCKLPNGQVRLIERFPDFDILSKRRITEAITVKYPPDPMKPFAHKHRIHQVRHRQAVEDLSDNVIGDSV